MASKTLSIPNELSGICLENECLQSLELKPFIKRSSKEVSVTTAMNLDLKVETQKETSKVKARTTYTIKTVETVEGESVVLADCAMKTFASYALPRGNVKQSEIMKYDWFFAYMAHSFIRRVLQETFINTELQSIPIPFSILKTGTDEA